MASNSKDEDLDLEIADDDKTAPKLDKATELPTGSTDQKEVKSPEDKPVKPHRLKAWWQKLSKRNKIIFASVATVVLATLVIAVSPLRYPVVGLVHKGQVTLTVVDDSTGQPIAGASVAIGGHTATTGAQGTAKLTGLALGQANVTITKHAYETKTVTTTVFWSTDDLGRIQIHSTGILVKFKVTDWVTDGGIAAATVTVGSSNAVTDSTGGAVVSLEPAALATAKATVTAGGYTGRTVAVGQAADKTTGIVLTPAGTVYYFSNRTGKRVDLYGSNLDGSGATVILAGSGSEDTQTGLLPNINSPDTMAIVSSRAGQHDNQGDLQHDLYIFNGVTKKLTKIDDDVSFNDFRAWSGSTLVYFKNNSDGSFAVKSYNTQTSAAKTLLAVPVPSDPNSYINAYGLGIVGNNIYYNVASSDANATGFYSLTLAGVPTRLDPGSVGQSYRQAKGTLIVSLTEGTNNVWKQLNFADHSFTTLAGEPTSQADRGYADSPDGQHSVFVETRDGKSQLYVTDGAGNNEQVITTSGDVNQFVQWYDNRYVAYSTNTKGSSIYIVGIAGGPAKKIADFFQGNGRTYGGGYNPNYF